MFAEVKEVEQVLGPEEEVAIDEFAKFERESLLSFLRAQSGFAR